MHALYVRARRAQAAGFSRSAAEDNGVVCRQERGIGLGVQQEGNAFGFHQPHAPLYNLLGQLHIGNTVHQQPAGAVGLFNDVDRVPHPVEQIGGGEPRGAAADHRRPFPRAQGGNARPDPAHFKALFDQIQLVVAVGHALIGQIAGFFAQRRAYPAREFRERGRHQKPFQRRLFLPMIQQIVPFRDQIMQGTSEVRLAEGHAAVHAARSLTAPGLRGLNGMQIVKIPNPRALVPVRVFGPGVFHETGRLAHTFTLLSDKPGIRRRSPL